MVINLRNNFHIWSTYQLRHQRKICAKKQAKKKNLYTKSFWKFDTKSESMRYFIVLLLFNMSKIKLIEAWT